MLRWKNWRFSWKMVHWKNLRFRNTWVKSSIDSAHNELCIKRPSAVYSWMQHRRNCIFRSGYKSHWKTSVCILRSDLNEARIEATNQTASIHKNKVFGCSVTCRAWKNAFKSIIAILGIIDDNVESVKIIGTRDMSMDSKTKTIFDEIDYTNQNFLNKFTKPYFNDVQENFIFDPFER